MERAKAALAGLLHDIGKFYQRAYSSPRQTLPSDYDVFRPQAWEETKRPPYGKHGAHAAWSAQFVEEYVPEAFRRAVGSAVFFHHNPQDRLSKLVALADRLAAGEREEKRDIQPKQVLSIFCQLRAGRPDKIAPRYMPLRPLEIAKDALFPEESAEQSSEEAVREAYRQLWEAFTQEAETLRDLDNLPAYIESFYYLLQRYTWCVPSAFYRTTPDIPLFDHSRVTAALAVCLSGLEEETLDALLYKPKEMSEHPVAYLVEGDISGVQKFIYTITSRGAAKGLRGRSFYLQLLTEALARYMLRYLDLPITNLIYVGGGHFYVLVPPEETDELDAIQEQFDSLLLEHHDGALYVALGKTPLSLADFRRGDFGQKWREVGQDVGRAKRRRYASALTLFDPRGHGGNEEHECQVCHAERADVEAVQNAPDEEPVRKCALCRSLEELGQQLGRAEMLFLGETEPQDAPLGGWENLLAALGVSVGLLDGNARWIKRPVRSAKLQDGVLLGLRTFPTPEQHADVERVLKMPLARGVRYTANVTPRLSDDQVATFEHLAKASQGIERLGVLRMDVDDLGFLFSSGFRQPDGSNHATLARVATLSSMFALFFEGWVGEICRQSNQKAREEGAWGTLYTIYSGGDDLFIVGSWDQLPKLAYTIATELHQFAAQNPHVHLSAGITLHPQKYPLYQAAESAHNALEAAKDLPGKNGFTFLGETFPWARYEEIDTLREKLLDLQKSPQVGRNLFRLLLRIYAEYHETKRRNAVGHEQIVYGPWMWHSAYQLTRLANRANDRKQDILALHDYLRQDNFHAIAAVGLAARWAEALTKPKTTEKERSAIQ